MPEEYFSDINRAAVIVKPKRPFIDWLVYTSKEYDGHEDELRPEEVKTEGFDLKNVYLIPAYDDTEKYEKYIKQYFADIFEHELSGWYTDPKMWPRDRSWKIFQKWFDYEVQTMVFDMTPDNLLKH